MDWTQLFSLLKVLIGVLGRIDGFIEPILHPNEVVAAPQGEPPVAVPAVDL